MKVLIAYGTRYGATRGTSEEIARILREEGFDTTIVNLKEEEVKGLSEYDLIVVGGGMRMGKWAGEAKDFLNKFQKEFAVKKLAVFVSSMGLFVESDGKAEEGGACSSRKVVEDMAAEYSLKPITIGFFGGVIDYTKMGFFERKTMGFLKPQLEKRGFNETAPGVYDLRDWDAIRTWAKDLSGKAKQ